MIMFTARITQEDADTICALGKGNRSEGLRLLLYCHDSQDDRIKDAYEHIKQLEKIIEDKNHIIKYQRKLIDGE